MTTLNDMLDEYGIAQLTKEYEGYDFGFSAITDDAPAPQTAVTTPPASTDDVHNQIQDALDPIRNTLETIVEKMENVENIIQSGIAESFDIGGYKALVEKDVNDKLRTLEGLIMPLLINLMKNPELDTIKWPNRKPIIEKQIEKIIAITRG